MNCEQFQQQILLAESGEQKRSDIQPLESHLATCDACQTFRRELTQLTTTVQKAPLEHDVSELTLARIQAAARENVPEQEPSSLPDRPAPAPTFSQWRPALTYAAAAVVMLVFGLHFIQQIKAPEIAQVTPAPAEYLAWDPAIDEELSALDDYLVLALDDINSGTQESTDDIATDLMNLEGWSI